jgi:hypothetical protein
MMRKYTRPAELPQEEGPLKQAMEEVKAEKIKPEPIPKNSIPNKNKRLKRIVGDRKAFAHMV